DDAGCDENRRLILSCCARGVNSSGIGEAMARRLFAGGDGRTPFLESLRPLYFHYRPRRGAVRSARQAHNLEVVGSNPTAATDCVQIQTARRAPAGRFCFLI